VSAADPLAATRRPTVELKIHPSPHPFVRRGVVVPPDPRPPPGTLVTLRTRDGTVLGDGFYNGESDVAVRRLTFGDRRFDEDALGEALDRALARRRLPEAEGDVTALRLVHGEGDGLSGLVVDRLDDVLVVECKAAGWRALLDPLVAALHERAGTRHHRAFLTGRTALREDVPAFDLRSEACPRRRRVREGPVRYHVDLELGHKTGFFCDQRENRARLASLAAGRDVIDLCCFTGGFALAAAVAGARSVTGVDLDERAIALARDNAKLNQVRVRLVHADAFDWARQVRAQERRAPLVVLDPPKFIPTVRDAEAGRGKYHDLNRLALGLVEPGGMLLTCSCSGLLPLDDFVELVRSAARKAGRRARILRTTGAGPDHPVDLECPESSYLKVLWLSVE